MSIDTSETAIAAVSTAPRITEDFLKSQIESRHDFIPGDVLRLPAPSAGSFGKQVPSLMVLSVCILVMRNGYTVIGKSAPADPANFDYHIGKELAFKDAFRQLWPLEGYQLRTLLAADSDTLLAELLP